jgi:ferrous iron transport protein A
MAAEGEPVRIVALRAGAGLDRRLADLGLSIGSEVRVVHHQGGKLVVARDATRLALGGGMAMKILVVPVAGTDP